MSGLRIFAGLIVLLLLCSQVLAQPGALRQAEKKMDNNNWESAYQILTKTLRKDTLNVSAELILCRWFLETKNPAHQIDSAYFHSIQALRNFRKSLPKQKEKLKHDHIDSLSIVKLRDKIDSIAFENSKQINTENSYQEFLQRHSFARERPVAIELRDEVAFLNALRQNSYTAFENYLKAYPQSHRARDASDRYEKLLFESKTKAGTLKSYSLFADQFPTSPYRSVADKNIFELSTIEGLPENFIRFINDYPKNSFANHARNILFHIARESEEKISSAWMTDSLRRVIEISKLVWVPTYKNGKFGFIDSRGKETFVPQFDAIKEEYKCGSVKEDILVTSGGLISRDGIRLADKASIVSDLGYGFLKVGDSSCIKVLHKSGAWIIEHCVQDATIVNGRFLSVKVNGLVGLYSLTGRLLLAPQLNAVEMADEVVILDRMGKKTLCLPSQLSFFADGNPLPENLVFDNVKSLGSGLLLVSNGSLEGIINSRLEFVVPLARQSLYQMPFGLVRKINDLFIFSDLGTELGNTSWEKYRFYRQWLLLKNSDGNKLVDIHSKKIIESDPDSLWVANGLVFAKGKDSVRVHINSSSVIGLPKNAKITFVKSADSVRYFFMEQKNKKVLFSIETGEKLFASEFDQIESLRPLRITDQPANTMPDVFILTKKNKKGLITKSGKQILPSEYDAVVLLHEGNQLSLLKEKKFGLYDLMSGKFIKPAFERNISQLDSGTLIAFKNNHYGLIDWSAKPLTPFEYDEILPWNENEILGKKGFEWSVVNFRNSTEWIKHIKNFQLFSDRREEKLAYIQQENYYGVISSTRGMIIPASFTYVTNLATRDEPLYFTAKDVEEAGIEVVIYYNKDGKLIRKQVYEEEEYMHIVCPED